MGTLLLEDENQIQNLYDDSYEHLLIRQRIRDVLVQAMEKPVVTIIAGAGYGKTLETSVFLKQHHNRTSWINLTRMDNLSMHFWDHFIKVVSVYNKPAGLLLSQIGFPEDDIAFFNFCKIFKDEVVKNEKLYCVVDDFFLLENSYVLGFFEKLAHARIPNMCLIFISREELQINIVPLVIQNALFRINEDVLRLTQEEMSDFFRQQNIILTGKAESEFYLYTGGWVFATQLVCLALKKDYLYQKNPFSMVKLDIFSLLENEMFSRVSPQIQRLIVKMSMLENIPAGFLHVVAENSGVDIGELGKIGSFIMYDRYNDVYRIHQLFQLFLKEKQNLLTKQEIEDVNLQAARWYEENGDRLDAINYYEKVNQYEKCAKIILTFTNRYPKESVNFLLGVLDRMPDEIIRKMPILRVLYAKYLLNNIIIKEAQDALLEIIREYENMPLTPEISEVIGEAYIMMGFQSMISSCFTRQYNVSDYFEKAYGCLPNGSRLNTGLRLNFGSYCLFVCTSEQGEADKAIADIKKMEVYCTKILDGLGSGFSNLMETENAYFKKELKQAEKFAYQSLAKSKKFDQYDLENHAYFLLMRIYVASGKYAKAMEQMELQKKLCRRVNVTEGYAVQDISQGWFYAQIGQTDKIPLWLKNAEKCKEIMSPITFGNDKLVRAKYLLAENKIYELLALCNEKTEGIAFETFLFQRIELNVLNAIALSLANDTQESVKVLQEAYKLAAPNELIMPFIENGKYTRTLFNRIGKYCDIPEEWLADIQMKASSYAKHLNSIVSNYNYQHITKVKDCTLSKRETRVLAGLSEGMTRNEIADECGISVNTVKTITQSVYSKLGVDNIYSAIRVATMLNLLE